MCIKKILKKAKYITIYEASDNENQTEVKRMLVNEFLNI